MDLHLRSAEPVMVQTLNTIRDQPGGWTVIHFHLSELLEQYKSEYQAKIAINLVHDLLKNYEGGVFLMQDQSIVVLCYGLEKTIQAKLIFQLRYLYMDDPLAYTDTGHDNPDFCTSYNLKYQWKEFHAMAARFLASATRKSMVLEKTDEVIIDEPEEKPARAEKESHVLVASQLAGIERDLARVELQKVLRRQPVCAVLPDKSVRRVFDELYIHISALRGMLNTEVDFLSNRWLFKYLTHALDVRMLDLIRNRPARFIESPISLNLNVETLLSARFAEFDAAIPAASKVSVVIEVPVVDVYADMAAFMLARDDMQRLGYRICLDGLTAASFSTISREKLGVDLVKVQWNAAAPGDLSSKENTDMAQAVQTTGSNRVILCRCDNRSAVEYGQALGISLFQGRYLDGVLNPTAKVEN